MKKLIFFLSLFAISFSGFSQSDTTVTNIATLDGSGSIDNNVNGGIVKYQWSQVSGTATTITNANSAIATVVFTQPGIYQYQLTVTNKAGLSDSQTMQVTVLAGDVKPQAIIIAVPVIKLPAQK